MNHLLSFLRYLLVALGALALLITLLSGLPTAVWWVQALGFPRLQVLAVLVLALAGLLWLGWPRHPRLLRLGLLALAAALLAQASYLWPYLPLMPKAVADATPTQAQDSASRVRILVINVLIKNRQDARLRRLVQATNPDVVLALEPDDWWARALRPLHAAYPYRIELPRANAYGLILYSRLPLLHPQTQDLEQPGVPSVLTGMRLADGRTFTFFGIHPTPPIPDNYPDGVGLRNIVLNKVARILRRTPGPTLVAGDFNDVSWSKTTHQLVAEGPMRDVSVGRGLFTTFDARVPLMRWPLDHFFVSPQFRVVSLTRAPDVGSDHFGLLAELALNKE
ncbi:MAG TPA: endonuclease/exonuclease/phosphatase family protein [Hymenobacter sp.]|uniref:endonuclease/exonuclease/phosphatase family protein n=1 Tax=Hymenobacter sp. TaxID=1898978 RepID=UPI002D801D2A|nr:endonuclease/exonuclease/phosphatase family protein [Hymenobacter sp.]HET9504818.1 endonuclease/exonuclease/phosphatase family protein [Hymenobacter sp.]